MKQFPSFARLRTLLALLFFSLAQVLSAQSIQVSDFHYDEFDTDANTAGTSFVDPNNGNKCALIKVHTTQRGFTFDVGALGVAKTEPQGGSHPTQIWVYVPQGVKRISVMHPQLGELLDYDLGMTLKSARTYHLTLQTGTLQTVVNPTLQKQFAVFTLVPANASLEVDGEAWEVNAQGQAARQLPFGTYQYRATAPRYKPSVGQFTVGKEKHAETITLTPNFSTITFQAPAGAEVWVDGQRRGTETCAVDLSAGEYQVECRQESHLATSKVITVGANQPRTIALDAPRPIYGLLSVNSTPFGAKVTVDGQAVGETPLSLDNVLIGQRQVAVTMDGYTAPAAKTVLVSQEQAAAVDFQMEKRQSASVTSSSQANPMSAQMFVEENSFRALPATVLTAHSRENKRYDSNGYLCAIIKIATIEKNFVFDAGDFGIFGEPRYRTGEVWVWVAEEAPFLEISHPQFGKLHYDFPLEIEEGRTYEMKLGLSQGKDRGNTQGGAGTRSFTVNGVTFTMVAVEGGTFTMGATSEQGSDAGDDEKPAHQVTLSSFSIGQTEVTQALWEAVLASNPSVSKGHNRPVESVSWKDCQKFIQKLNKLTGQRFRLPTEAEWEYAARGGNKSKGYMYSGSNDLGSVAWYDDNSGRSTHDVATKAPNELGLYDMSGNVYEWCQDWYDFGYYKKSPSGNPSGPPSGSNRVLRGGSWCYNVTSCRVANRYYYAPAFRFNYMGFRLAL